MQQATITRTFDAPRERVWRSLTEPAELAAWFGTPPYTTDPATVTIEARPGGRFAATMVHESDGTQLPFRGRYEEVVEPERLVQTLEDVDDASNPNVETLTYTLADVGGGRTELTTTRRATCPRSSTR